MKWIEWDGGEPPSGLHQEQMVIVKFRGGGIACRFSYELSWHRYDGPWDIVAYVPMSDVIAELDKNSRPKRIEWIAWLGGDRPVPADTLVDLVFRNGDRSSFARAGLLVWGHRQGVERGYDIVSYRVSEGS